MQVASKSCKNLSTHVHFEMIVPQDRNVGATRNTASGREGWLLKGLRVSPPVPGSVGKPILGSCSCQATEAAAAKHTIALQEVMKRS